MRISDWSSDVCSSDLLDADTFSAVPEISIDYALMEKSSNVAVIPCEIGWSDIGSWTALSGLGVADEDGNCVQGDALLDDVHDCFIQSSERLVGAVGVDNLIIDRKSQRLNSSHYFATRMP